MTETKQATRTKHRLHTTEPPMYCVRMHNDDVTTMDFVVMVLCAVFYKAQEDATKLMLEIHNHGSAIVGTFPLDIALSKANKAHKLAKNNGFPLKLTVEKI